MNVVYWSACSPVLRWAKLVMTENMNISVVFFAETLPRSRRDQNPLLYLKEERHHLAIKCKSIIKKIPWGCSCAIYKVSSIDVRNRWIIRLHDMTPSVQNIVWLKLFCSMFLMEKKKSFRWGFTNNIGCCVIICWNAYAIHASGLNWPIHPWWGHWDFRFFF